MENEVLNSQPTVVESNATDTNVATNTVDDTNVGEPTVVEQPTPMDNNVTYENIPKQDITIDTNKDFSQNLVQNVIAIERKDAINANAGSAMDNFLNNEYDYDKNEAGTYWVAGAINDVNTQMSFLNAIINEEMYDEMDLQKYYYDTTMATARAYAASKEKETAYGFYRAAQEKAIAEASLTGWYMPAEGQYMLGQYTVAQNVLEDPNADDESRNKATRISNTVQKWFNANQISTRGIKCLTMMNYEENVRHNTIMGELQKEANKIAAQGAAASGAATDLQLREFKFQVEEMEMQSGFDYTGALGMDTDNYYGHNPENYKDSNLSALQGFDSIEKLMQDPYYYSAILTARGKNWVDDILKTHGIDGKELFKGYNNDQTLATWKSEVNNGATSITTGFESTGKKTKDGQDIVMTVTGNEVVVGYFKDGVWNPITDKDYKTSDDSLLNTFVKNRYGIDFNTEGINAVEIDGKIYGFGRQPEVGTTRSYKTLTEDLKWEKMTVNNWDHYNDTKVKERVYASQSPEGTTDKDGNVVKNLKLETNKYESEHLNEFMILSGTNEKGETKYYSIETDGELKPITNVKDAPSSLKEAFKKGDEFDAGADFNGDQPNEIVSKLSYKVTYNKEKNCTVMAYPHTDGSVEYYTVKGNIKANEDNNKAKILQLNISEEEVNKIGGKTMSSLTTEQKSKSTFYNVVGNTKKEEEKKTTISNTNTNNYIKTSDGYEAQDTVEKKDIAYNKYSSTEKEKENPEFLNGLGSYDIIKNRKNINQVNT